MMTHTAKPTEGSVLTPVLLLDEAQMLRNIHTMNRRLEGSSVVLRPHVKTAKSLPVIERMVAGHSEPRLTASTLRETAEALAAGYSDVLYAVGVVPQKLPELARLARRHRARVSVILDSVAMAQALAAAALAERGNPDVPVSERVFRACDEFVDGPAVDAFIELDVDDHRAGVAPESAELIEIGGVLAGASSGSLLRGVMTHAGGAYDCRGLVELEAMAERERTGAVQAADALRAVGLDCREVSIGSTPTVHAGSTFDGVTEARVGVYVFNDLVMAGLGVCAPEDIAISVLSTVIGHQPKRNTLLIDAGWMALSSDRSTAAQPLDQGLGRVIDNSPDRTQRLSDLIVTGANQEHGLVTTRAGTHLDFDQYPIGSQVQILPIHACATAAQFDGYQVTREGLSQPEFWPRFGGWACQIDS